MVTTNDRIAVTEARAPAGRTRRFAEVTAFVAVWIALGYLMPPDPNLYLLVGVPLTVAFQLIVRRRPLRELWVRDGLAFHLDRKGKMIAGALMVLPAVMLIQTLAAGQWIPAGWPVACLVGAVAAAYSLRQLRREDIANTLRWVAVPTVIGVAVLGARIVPALVASGQPLQPLGMLLTGLQSTALYFPVVFVLEEVSFRGALDTHAHRPGDRRGWLSALFVSALWGLWHLPIVDTSQGVLAAVASLLVVHGAIGVPLSFGWRRTGSLLAPGLAHALIDGVRDALQAGGIS